MGKIRESVGRFCPYCGSIITADEYFCRACHRRLTDQADLDAPYHQKAGTYVVHLRKTYLSALLSCTAVGLGQFYNGDTFRGLAFFLAFILVSFGYIGQDLRTYLYFGIWAAAVVEALVSSYRINHYYRYSSGASYLLWAELAVVVLIIVLHVSTGLPDIDYLRKVFPTVNLWTMVQG
jgi:TM2 domain-containing membrane protein YozV